MSLAACETLAWSAEGVTMRGIWRSDHVDFRRDTAAHYAAIIARQDAGDRVKMPVQFERSAQNLSIAIQPFAPETVADHGDGTAFIGLGVALTAQCTYAENIEEIRAGHHLPGNFAVRTGTPVDIGEPDVESQILKRARLAQLPVTRIGHVGSDARQAVRLTSAEVVQDHFTHNAENSYVGANAKGQRTHRGRGEHWRSTEASERVRNVAE